MSKRKSLKNQMRTSLTELKQFGCSKEVSRLIHGTHNPPYIYSVRTFDNYLHNCYTYADWVKSTHPDCKKIDDAKQYVPEYLNHCKDKNLSAWTIRAYASALAKLYRCKSTDFAVDYPERRRADIKRDRIAPDKETIEKNKDIIDFCTGTGLRAHELRSVHPKDIYKSADGHLYVHVEKGKGGKKREAQVLKEFEPVVMRLAATKKSNEKIFRDVPDDSKLHYFRSMYATLLYKRVARKKKDITSQKERYVMRRDRSGIVLDRKAMLFVSKQLGHARENVIATSYLDIDSLAEFQ